MKPLHIAAGAAALLVIVGAGWMVASKFNLNVPPPIKEHTPSSDGNVKHKNAYLTDNDPHEHVDDLGPRKWKIIDVHEHLKGEREADMLLAEMDKLGIQRTCLMASTTYTLTLNPIYGFEGFKENNEKLIEIKKAHPDRFAAFVTLNPLDEGNLPLLQDYVKRGADGLKLYVGHGAIIGKGEAFHSMPIDDPRLEPIFAWAEETQLPIVLHVNLEKYWDEMLRVLEKHPYLRVNMPHMGLYKNTDGKMKRLAMLLERYPNTFSDMSFGYYTYQLDGFEVLAMYKSRSREFMVKHKDRMLYASDMVLEPAKDQPYIDNTLRSYMQFLEKDPWRCYLVPKKTMKGMGLDDDTLHHIYEVAPARFLLLDDKGNLPDRTKGTPAIVTAMQRPPLPPLTPDMIPPLNNGPPAGTGPSGASKKPLEDRPAEDAPKQAGAELDSRVPDDDVESDDE